MNDAQASVLESMPPAFTARRYAEDTGVDTSEAEEHLRCLEADGAVAEQKLGLWWNLAAEWPENNEILLQSGGHPCQWHRQWEFQMDALYGDAPRRISGLCALGAAGVGLMCRSEISVASGSESDTDVLGFASYSEDPETLLLHAYQLTKNTWVSTPARALVESAQFPNRSYAWEEHFGFMAVEKIEVCTPDMAAAVAADLGYEAALRRLASVADALNNSPVADSLDFTVGHNWLKILPEASKDDAWIWLTQHENPNRSPCEGEHDALRRVRWGRFVTRDRLAMNIST